MQQDLLNYLLLYKKGDINSLENLIEKFIPLINKYASKLDDYEDAKSELTLHFILTINRLVSNKIKLTEDKYIISYINTSIKHQYIFLSKKQ